MSTAAQTSPRPFKLGAFRPQMKRATTTLRWCLLALLVTMPGCGGCRTGQTDAEQRAEALRAKQEEEEKPDFEPPRISVLPATIPAMAKDLAELDKDTPPEELPEEDFETLVRSLTIKPGHWMEVWHQLKSNKRDFVGRLNLFMSDRERRPWMLERSKFQLVCSRPVSLPKAQTKLVDATTFMTMPDNSRRSKAVQIEAQLEGRTGAMQLVTAVPTVRLRPHQFFLPVLASRPEQYGFLKLLHSVQPPEGNWNLDGIREDYFVVLPNIARRIPLPQRGLAWTSIAYIVVDDVDPELFTGAQQQAMVDWLHWGGQLLISGPNSLERLQGSFLEEYLPASPASVATVDAARLAALDQVWSRVPRHTRRAPDTFMLAREGQPPVEALELVPNDEAHFVPHTSDLVVARRVGRGRITVTAFALSDGRFVNWGCFDNFFNACLLRRPPRRFDRNEEMLTRFVHFDGETLFHDARPRAALRYFSRDAQLVEGSYPPHRSALDNEPEEFRPSRARRWQPPRARRRERELPEESEQPPKPEGVIWEVGEVAEGHGFGHDPISGVGGWNDFSDASVAAREALVQAAGIDVPNKQFISRVLLGYLICLVPLNWLVFKLMGRVEWAWFAAPLIAICGAVTVIQVAQLDIGFARSRTDIQLLELQSGYTRGHLTAFSGLYTSLTTRYAATSEDKAAMSLPFSTAPSDQQLRLQVDQIVSLDYDRQTALTGYPVFSNSTGMLHSEDMVDLAGSIEARRIDGDQLLLSNGTGLTWRTVLVLQRVGDRLRVATLDSLDGDSSPTLTLGQPGDEGDLFARLESDPVTSASIPDGEPSLRQLYKLATDGRQLEPGQLRVIGWSDQALDVFQIKPAANQRSTRTLLVANVQYDHGPPPRADTNHPEDPSPLEVFEGEIN